MSHLLVPGTLALLFVGFVKGLADWPIDLTFVSLVVVVLALVPQRRLLLPTITTTSGLFLVGLCVYLAVRVGPQIPIVGVEKLSRILLIGLPVFFASYLIAGDRRRSATLSKSLMVGGLIVSLTVGVNAAVGDTGVRQSFLTGGYQLTGILIGLALVIAAVKRRHMVVAATVLGSTVCGSTSAVLAILMVFVVWIVRRDLRAAAIGGGLSLVLVVGFAAISKPPVLFTVVGSKLVGIGVNLMGPCPDALSGAWPCVDRSSMTQVAPDSMKQVAPDSMKQVAPDSMKQVAPDPRAATEAASADRLWLWVDAVRHWSAAPVLGNGLGALTYLLPEHVYPHNIFLELLAETGLAGFALFLAFLLSLVMAVKHWPDRLATVAPAAFLLLMSLISGDLGSRLLWFGLGLLFAAGDQLPTNEKVDANKGPIPMKGVCVTPGRLLG